MLDQKNFGIKGVKSSYLFVSSIFSYLTGYFFFQEQSFSEILNKLIES